MPEKKPPPIPGHNASPSEWAAYWRYMLLTILDNYAYGNLSRRDFVGGMTTIGQAALPRQESTT